MIVPAPEFRQSTNASELASMLAEHVGGLLRAEIREHGQAALIVSGGTTPVPFFKALASLELEWAKVVITLADERWVPAIASDSNENLVRRHLLVGRAAAARFVGLKTKAPTAKSAEDGCAARLAQLPSPVAVAVLGMGNDGHTASLFPGAIGLAEAMDMHSGRRCMAITPPTAPHERLTLTLPALLRARQIILHITGPEKRAAYEKALAGGPAVEMPVRAILTQKDVPVVVFWSPA